MQDVLQKIAENSKFPCVHERKTHFVNVFTAKLLPRRAGGQCPLTIQDWKAGNNCYTIGPSRFVSAAVGGRF